MTPCMGGWCTKREMCAAYKYGMATDDVRLCKRGAEQPKEVVQVFQKKRVIEVKHANA